MAILSKICYIFRDVKMVATATETALWRKATGNGIADATAGSRGTPASTSSNPTAATTLIMTEVSVLVQGGAGGLTVGLG